MNKETKRLKNFLRSKKLLTRFKLNSRNCITGIDTPFISGKYISSYFIWSGTPEGHDFWKNIDREFDSLR